MFVLDRNIEYVTFLSPYKVLVFVLEVTLIHASFIAPKNVLM